MCGSPLGIPPKRDPTVSTGSFSSQAAIVAPSIAMIGPGMRAETVRQMIITATVHTASKVACHDQVGAATARAFMRSQNSPGTFCKLKPKRSLICVLAIKTAMPLVNPITTGRGMNLTADPMPVAPSTTSRTPAITVHMKRPSTPCTATIPATTTTNAPVGPPIWVFDPPSAEIRNPVTIAQ